jgi:hypothetical protein
MKKSLTLYSFGFGWDRCVNVSYQSLDEAALKKYRDECLNSDAETITEIVSSDLKSSMYQAPFGSGHSSFICGDAVKVGSMHVDRKCSGTRDFYTLPCMYEQAKEDFQAEEARQKQSSDAYYSSPWV